MKKTVTFHAGTSSVAKSFEVASGCIVIPKKEMETIAKKLGYPVTMKIDVSGKAEKLKHGIPSHRSTECWYIELETPVDAKSWAKKFKHAK